MLASLEPARKAGGKARPRTPEWPAASSRPVDRPTPWGRVWTIAGLLLVVVAIGGAYVGVIRGQALQPGTMAEASIDPQSNPVVAALTSPSAPVDASPASIEVLPDRPDAASSPGLAPSAAAPAASPASASPPALSSARGLPAATRPQTPEPTDHGSPFNALGAEPPDKPVVPPPQPTHVDAALTPAQKRKATQAGDSALLKALVQHVAAHSKEEVKGTMPPLRLKGSKTPMTTIAQIVNHCRSLEGEEAKVCKVRICENYWGKDDACSTRPDFHRFETSAR